MVRSLVWLLTFVVHSVTLLCVCPADANQITIAAAGAVPPLIALLASLSVEVQGAAAGALRNLAANNGTCACLEGDVRHAQRYWVCSTGAIKITIAAAGAH